MKRLEEIMVEYAREKGGGLPLTPQEMCNAVVLWVQEKLLAEVKETYPSFEGDRGVEVEHNEADNHYVFSLNTEYVQSIIPEVTAETLLSLFEGSDTIVVDLSEDGNKIEFHLDGEVVNKLSRALLTPVQNPSEVELVAIGTDGSQKNIPISEVIGGGGGLEKLTGDYMPGSGRMYNVSGEDILLVNIRYKNEDREGGVFDTWLVPVPWRASISKTFSNTLRQSGTYYIRVGIDGISTDTSNENMYVYVDIGPSQDEGVTEDVYLDPELYGVEVYKLV